MLKEASVAEMKKFGIPKERRVLVNRGRGNDELAPADELYKEMGARKAELEKALGTGSAAAHNGAYLECGFAKRFRAQVEADPAALEKLEVIAKRAGAEDLYLVCYEGPSKACHRRILLRMAEEKFGAPVEVTGVEP